MGVSFWDVMFSGKMPNDGGLIQIIARLMGILLFPSSLLYKCKTITAKKANENGAML
jgi:hypothetical protein